MKRLILALAALFSLSFGAAVAQGPGGGVGPGPSPDGWTVIGPAVVYDEGGALMPRDVTGGDMGVGTINVSGGYYVNGINITGLPCDDCALKSQSLAQFASTTSAQLAGVISNETGSGLLVFNNSPSLIGPVITGSFTATGLVGLTNLATQAANTVLVNPTSAAASPVAQAVPSCTGPANALQWVTNTGIQCGVITAAASSVAIGTTSITGGATTRVLYDNAGVLGEYTITGTGSVAMSASPTFTGTITAAAANFSGTTNFTGAFQIAGIAQTFPTSGILVGTTDTQTLTNKTLTSPILTTPQLGVATATSLAINGCTIGTNGLCITGTAAISGTLTSAAHTITSNSTGALAVGPNGATNPAFVVDASTASSATGLSVKSAAAGGGVALAAISSGTNESLSINGKGSGGVFIAGSSTGQVQIGNGGGGVLVGSALTYGGVTLANSVTGTGSMVLSQSPTFTGVATFSSATFTNPVTISTAGASALSVAAATNPALVVDTSAASQATGIKITGQGAGGGANISVVSTGTNEALNIDAKGTGTITLGGSSTGNISLNRALVYGGVTLANSVTGTGSMVLSVAPTITGHPTIEGVTSTGATGTGNFVFSSNPSVSNLTVTSAFTATGLVTYANMASAAIATNANYLSGAASVLVPASVIYQAETTTTFGATTTLDFNTFINTAVTLTGNITTLTLANVKSGKAGQIRFIQDGTGGRTTVWNSILKFTGGITPALSATAGAVDVLNYSCISATYCVAALMNDVK